MKIGPLSVIVLVGLCSGSVVRSEPSTRAAQPAASPVGVGVYAPEVPLDPYQWFAFAGELAHHLSRTSGIPVQGLAYKRSRDLLRDLGARKIQYAVVGALWIGARPTTRVLATARPDPWQRWSLLARSKTLVGAMRGKVLQLPRLGRLGPGLVENGLLAANIDIRRHFKIAEAPSTLSAIEAVRLGQADVVFAPVPTRHLVSVMSRSIVLPPPAFVLLSPRQPAGQVSRLSAAILSFTSDTAAIGRWGPPATELYPALARLASKQPLKMSLLPTGAPRVRRRDVVDDQEVELELPAVEDLFRVP